MERWMAEKKITYKVWSRNFISGMGRWNMQRKLLEIISVGFDATGQLLIVYSAFDRHLRNNGNIMNQCFGHLQTSKKLILPLGMRYCIIFPLSLVSPWNQTKANKNVSDWNLWQSPCRQAFVKHVSCYERFVEGEALSPLIFNSTLERAVRKVQVSQDDMQLNGTHQLLVCAVDINTLGWSAQTIQTSTECLVASSQVTWLEANADKTKCMVMSRRRHNIKTDNSSFEKVEHFRYLRTTLTNQNFIQEHIKSRLKSGNASYHSVPIGYAKIKGWDIRNCNFACCFV